MTYTRAVIFDLDGTLANCEHRRHFVTSDEKKNWEAFYENMVHDSLNFPVYELYRSLPYLQRIIVTGRPNQYREQTARWLAKHYIEFDRLLMRGDGDFRQDYIIKEEILKEMILPHYEVLFAVDDRKQVVDMWRANGITCFQCADGDF